MIYCASLKVQLHKNSLNILLEKTPFLCLTNSPLKYNHILLGKIQYSY